MDFKTVETEGKPAFRRASQTDRLILLNITEPPLRARFHRHLVEVSGVVFLPEEVDQTAFDQLMMTNEELRAYVEDPRTDPCLIAEYLLRQHPELFIAFEQVYQVTVDYKIRRCKRTVAPESDRIDEGRPPLPRDFYERMSEDNITMCVKRRIRSDVRAFNCDADGYLATLANALQNAEHANERKIIERLAKLFASLREMHFPEFHEHIKGSETPFPSMHVRVWIKQILERGSALICGDVGTQKTSAAIIGLHELGAKRTVVICRSYARGLVWEPEIPVYFKEAPPVLKLEGINDLRRLESMSTRELREFHYLLIGYGDLQSVNADRWVKAIERYHADAIIIDEAHAINHDVARTRRVIALSQHATIKHHIMLTATPFENHPNEAANMAMILDPKAFPTQAHFDAYCRDHPRVFFGLMSKLMCEYFASDEVLDLPPCNMERLAAFPTVEIEPSYAAKYVHDLIRYDGSLVPTTQIQRMAQVGTCPYLGRNWYQYPAEVNGYFRDPEKSDKLMWVKHEIESRIATGKIVVASGLFASGVTHGVEGSQDDESEYVVVDQLRRWFGKDAVVHIDGTMAVSDDIDLNETRTAAINRWKHDDRVRIAVISVQAAAESFNMTLVRKPGVIEKLTILVLALGWKPTQLHQFIGRFRRPGMEISTEVLIAILKGLVDEAFLKMNQQKWRNFLMGIQMIPLQEDETKALEKRITSKYLDTDDRWLGDVLVKVRGVGEQKAMKFLDGMFRERVTGKTFARIYLENEDFSLSGDVARFLAQVYKPWLKEQKIAAENILDAACGILMLERRLGEPVYGIDMNPWMVETGREHSYQGGKNAIVGRLSELPEEWNEKFRLTVCSLALHWSTNKGKTKSERLKILEGLARVTAKDGLIHLTLPPSCFSEEMIGEWTGALVGLGLERVNEMTGLVETRDFADNPRTFWSVCLRKVGEANVEEVNQTALFFADERKRMTDTVDVAPKRNGTPTQPVPPAHVKHEAFVVLTDEGAQTPEAVSNAIAKKCFAEEVMWYRPFLAEMRRQFRPDERWLAEFEAELERIRPQKLTDFSKVWNNVFKTAGAPKIKRATLRALANQAMRTTGLTP